MAQVIPVHPHDAQYSYTRELSDYRLNFKSEKYPLLAFIYAIFAGGEGPLHFDFTADYDREYLLEPFGGKLEDSPPHVRRFIERLDLLEQRTNGRTEYVAMDDEDWDVFIECLTEELKGQLHTRAFW